MDPAEVSRLVSDLERAGLLTVGVDDAGRETWTLTPLGAAAARQMAMGSEDDALELLRALVDLPRDGQISTLA